MNNPYLLVGLEKTPDVLRRLLAVIPPEEFDKHPDPERFSLREALCHLADWEAIFRDRMLGTLSQTGYEMVVYDEAEFVTTHNYGEQDLSSALDRFTAERGQTIAFLASVPLDAWEKVGRHPQRGDLTVADQASMILGHDMYHLDQFSSRLG